MPAAGRARRAPAVFNPDARRCSGELHGKRTGIKKIAYGVTRSIRA